MNKLIVAAALTAALATTASAQAEEQYVKDEQVTKELATLVLLAYVDYNQSVDMFYNKRGFTEINPMLGKNPSRDAMFKYGVIGIGLVYIISKYLSTPYKQIFIDSILASEHFNIEDNRQVAYGFNINGPPIHKRNFSGVPIIISIKF